MLPLPNTLWDNITIDPIPISKVNATQENTDVGAIRESPLLFSENGINAYNKIKIGLRRDFTQILDSYTSLC